MKITKNVPADDEVTQGRDILLVIPFNLFDSFVDLLYLGFAFELLIVRMDVHLISVVNLV